MRKRSEAKPAAPQTAVDRTIELPIAKPDLVSHDGKVSCPTCAEIVMLGKCTQRADGRFECCECGAVIDDVAITSNNARKLTLQDHADADQAAAHHAEQEAKTHPRNGGLAGYCGECGAAWPYLKGELYKSCGHVNAASVEHPTEAKKIAPPAGMQEQGPSSPRARPQAITNVSNVSAAPALSNRLSIPWGEARMPVDQYNNFRCGGFIVTVDLAPGEDRVQAATSILSELEEIADIAFEKQHAWYLKKLGRLGVPGF